MGESFAREKILNAAEATFAEHGYAGTSFRQIVERVYRYFKPPFPRSARAAGSREAVNRAVFGVNPPLSMTIHLLTPALN